MIEKFLDYLRLLVGPDNPGLSVGYMAVRVVIIYILAITLVRLGKRRFLSKPSPFDLVLMLIFGSIISRAITGNVPFLPTISAAFVLLLLHTVFSYLTFHSTKIGALIKGKPLMLIKDGKIQWDKMRESQITKRDLLSALRRNAKILDPKDVKLAILERNGEISVLPGKKEPKIIDIEIEDGIKTIKLEIND